MSTAARKLLATFERLDPEDRREVAIGIFRLVRDDDGLEAELQASTAALSRMLDEEESQNTQSQTR